MPGLAPACTYESAAVQIYYIPFVGVLLFLSVKLSHARLPRFPPRKMISGFENDLSTY